jgi:hypothetical protein
VAYPPVQISIAYSGGPATLTIPPASNYSDYVQSIQRAGGFWTPSPANASSSQTQTFIPWASITSITAQ